MRFSRLTPVFVLLLLVIADSPPAYAQQSPGFGNLFPPVRRARQTAILIEIDQLHSAFQAYREKSGATPPCMGDTDADRRKTRFMKHVAAAWPVSKYGTTAADYDALQKKIASQWNYQFVDAEGRLAPLDLDRLDPAEAVVFWLAGFPAPLDPATKRPLTEGKVFVFHRDPSDPFKRVPADEADDPLKTRTHRIFDFRLEGLVDKDQDGWLEYLPASPKDDPDCAPFVYFDSAAYAETTKTVERLGTCFFPRDASLAKRWGVAAPYLEKFDSKDPTASVWANPDSFQVIAGGLDGRYGLPGDGTNPPAARLLTVKPLKVFQAADRFAAPHDVDAAAHDNLTNLASEPIGEWKP